MALKELIFWLNFTKIFFAALGGCYVRKFTLLKGSTGALGHRYRLAGLSIHKFSKDIEFLQKYYNFSVIMNIYF